MLVRRCFIVLAAFALLASITGGAVAAIKMPTWPQSFTLEKGESYSISIPVTRAGKISISLSWQGGPLTAVVKDQKGVALMSPTALRGGKAKSDYTVTPQDLQRGVLWTLTLSARRAAKITGQVTMTFPQIDMVKAEAATHSLIPVSTKPTHAQIAQLASRAHQSFAAKRDAFSKKRQSQLVKMRATTKNFLQNKLKSIKIAASTTTTTTADSNSASATTTTTTSKPSHLASKSTGVVAVSPPKVDISQVGPAAAATLTAVSPSQGKTGSTVTVTGTSLLPDKYFTALNPDLTIYWSGAMFTVAAKTQKPAKLLTARKNADGTQSIDIQVPAGAAGQVNPYAGDICLYGNNGKTNTIAFKYEPSGLPTITSASPTSAGPNDHIVLKGVFFSKADKVYMDLGNGDVAVPMTYASEKQVAITVPDYPAGASGSRRLYIAHHYSSGWNGGDPVYVTLLPTGVTLDAAYYTSGSTMDSSNPQGQPGDPIVLTGNGFVKPEVHFIVAKGVDKVATIDFSDGSTIRTSVPDVDGVPGDYAGSVYVTCNNKKSNLINFTFHPTIDYQMIDLYKLRPDDIGDISFSQKGMNNDYMYLPDGDANNPSAWTCNTMTGHHTGELLWGFKDDDKYYQKKRLKNGWKVSYIDVTSDENRARLDDSSVGTDSPYADVHWWVDACGFCDYYVTWHIEGPKGTTYY